MMRHEQRFHAQPSLLQALQTQERSQRWLAAKTGISTSQMNGVVLGKRTLRADQAQRVASALGTVVSVLFLSESLDGMSEDNDETEEAA